MRERESNDCCTKRWPVPPDPVTLHLACSAIVQAIADHLKKQQQVRDDFEKISAAD